MHVPNNLMAWQQTDLQMGKKLLVSLLLFVHSPAAKLTYAVNSRILLDLTLQIHITINHQYCTILSLGEEKTSGFIGSTFDYFVGFDEWQYWYVGENVRGEIYIFVAAVVEMFLEKG